MASATNQQVFYNADGTIRSQGRKDYIIISDDEDEPVSRSGYRDRTPDVPAGGVDVSVESQVCCQLSLHATH